MLHRLAEVLNAEDLATIRDLTADRSAFIDGASTAGAAARAVKANRQMAPGPKADAVRRLCEAALNRHGVFQAAAQPTRILRTLISLYGPGEAYGLHVDDAIMGGARSDLSFTLFVADPESYEGGELALQDSSGETGIKLSAGDAVLYPTGALHQVKPVIGGERLAVVGWVRSFVRRADQRDILFDLSLTISALHARDGKSAEVDRLMKTRTNLLRQWAED
ncbi:MAG: Fe2+-dependent dioxygenase [Oceanicaulis sp.]